MVLSCPSELSEVRQQTGVTYSDASSCFQLLPAVTFSVKDSHVLFPGIRASQWHIGKEDGTLLRAGWAQPRGTCHQLCALAGLCAMGEHQLVAHMAWGILTQPRHASEEFSSSQGASMELCSAQAQAVPLLLFVLGQPVFPRAAVQAGSVAPDLLCSVCLPQIPHLWGLSRVIRGLRAGQSLSGGWLIYKCSDCPQS